jgi:hypothetical protein
MEIDLGVRASLVEILREANKAIASMESKRFTGIQRMREDDLPQRIQLNLGAERWPVDGATTKKRRRGEGI